MEEVVGQFATYAALAIEAVAAVLIAYASAEALAKVLGHLLSGTAPVGWRREIFVRFGVWLLLGLQFALAADIVDSLIAPTWEALGHLAAIAAIRTFLNYFLEKDLDEAAEASAKSGPENAA
jgi:uncharacterized membrane protein